MILKRWVSNIYPDSHRSPKARIVLWGSVARRFRFLVEKSSFFRFLDDISPCIESIIVPRVICSSSSSSSPSSSSSSSTMITVCSLMRPFPFDCGLSRPSVATSAVIYHRIFGCILCKAVLCADIRRCLVENDLSTCEVLFKRCICHCIFWMFLTSSSNVILISECKRDPVIWVSRVWISAAAYSADVASRSRGVRWLEEGCGSRDDSSSSSSKAAVS